LAKTFVAIAGNMGSGKTTLTKLLSARFSWEPFFEPVAENPYLADFYADMKRWAFQLQITFLTHRFADHQRLLREDISAIQDRTIYEDAEIFARNLFESGHMDGRDWAAYSMLAETMCEHLAPPDLLVYLRKSVPRLAQRIHERGRSYEQGVPLEYLTRLNEAYERWIAGYRRGKLLVIDAEHLDFLEEPSHLEEIERLITDALGQRELFSLGAAP
jgi:deoxyadenosine/deoxycytidine kinase